jgi:hypothetical protein
VVIDGFHVVCFSFSLRLDVSGDIAVVVVIACRASHAVGMNMVFSRCFDVLRSALGSGRVGARR